MARIKIEDLLKDVEISREGMRTISGGIVRWPTRGKNWVTIYDIETVPLPE